MNVNQYSISDSKVYDVLIVGAGPVGLAIAVGLKKRGINNILVIDKTHNFRPVGQGFDLLPNGLKAIKYIDENAYEEIKKASSTFSQQSKQANSNDDKNQIKERKTALKRLWNRKNLQGEIIYSAPLDFDTWFNNYGEGRISIPWYDLQTTLRNLLPPEMVKANHRCLNVESENHWMCITCISDEAIETNPFANWEMLKSEALNNTSTDENAISKNQTSSEHQFRAKLVIAADGINSTIRQMLYQNTDLQNWAKPQYSGFVGIACLTIENIPDSIIQELELKYFQDETIITLQHNPVKSDLPNIAQPYIILVRKSNNTLGYLLHAPISLDLFQNKSAQELINLGIERLEKSGFPSVVCDLVSLSNPQNLLHRPYYIHPADITDTSQSIWSQGRIVLVGDAAHGMPPFAAQGANQGLEDAALISTLISKIIHNNNLDDLDVISSAFSQYEQIRRPFMLKIQEATMQKQNWGAQEHDAYNKMVYSRNFNF
jgi:2-polyprenyl-6-methoxyphenol hydroxylase-like FAD-dependent oxidoreductase